MPYQQKGKIVFHVSIDPNRAALLVEDARANDSRPAAWVRELVHRHLASDASSVADQYEDARAADDKAWVDSYKTRFEGRKKSSVEEGS